jgi:hypothetical protein
MEIKTIYERVAEGNRLFSLDNNKEVNNEKDKDVKFNGGVGSGIKGHRTYKPLKIKERNLPKYRNITELRQYLSNYYNKKYKGDSVKQKELGEISFTKTGKHEIRKISKNMSLKYKLVPFIKQMIKKGEIKELDKKLKHIRKDDITSFSKINTKVDLKSKIYNANILVGKSESKGNIFYDYFVDRKKP